MKAVILAAGYATRLYPLTKDKPKPLLDVAGKPILGWILDKIREVPEINEIFIVTNDKFYETFQTWAKDQEGVTILNDGTTSNEDRLGVMGDICYAINQADIQEDLLIVGGDNLFEFDLNRLAQLSEKKNASTIGVYDVKTVEEAQKMGICALDSEGKIIEIEEKPENPKSTLASTLCYFIRKEDIPTVCAQNVQDGVPLPKLLMKTKPIYAVIYTEPWFDIGSHEQYQEVNEIYKK
ncbi:nucleotidyltransferase family protein [Candidatus Woesearchaeota archaeon]|nr:nucleotidyltransferase family protein [Candidatus Woesearchaeota archaeon]MBW2994256.1 nucleotidyltransferase family protein [Candidatus Woesearchaeota archaeon]